MGFFFVFFLDIETNGDFLFRGISFLPILMAFVLSFTRVWSLGRGGDKSFVVFLFFFSVGKEKLSYSILICTHFSVDDQLATF